MSLHAPRVAPEKPTPHRPGDVQFSGDIKEVDMQQQSIEISTKAMLIDLKATFPTLWAKPLSEFDKAYAGREGVWTGVDGDLMPDGSEIFCQTGGDGYDGIVNERFLTWLNRRGWAYERYDGTTIHLLPNSAFM